MTDLRDTDGNLLPDDKRIGTYGHFLRASSLDEMPELLNILKGQMSFVGPRPLLTTYNDRYSAEEAIRLSVVPGLTGYSQVKGRNTLSWSEKFAYDRYYVKNQSLWLDLKILLMTIFVVLKASGITTKDGSSMPEFTGSEGSKD